MENEHFSYVRLRNIYVNVVELVSGLLFLIKSPEFHHLIGRRIVQKIFASFREACLNLFAPFPSRRMHSAVVPINSGNQ